MKIVLRYSIFVVVWLPMFVFCFICRKIGELGDKVVDIANIVDDYMIGLK